jgi:hypothetical protein
MMSSFVAAIFGISIKLLRVPIVEASEFPGRRTAAAQVLRTNILPSHAAQPSSP